MPLAQTPETTQPCISIQDIKDAITETYLNFIDLDNHTSLEITLGKFIALGDLAISIGAHDAAIDAANLMQLCRERNAEKEAILHGGCGP